VEKCGRAGQATDYNIIRHMRFGCWVTKATDTHSEEVMLLAFPLVVTRKTLDITLYVMRIEVVYPKDVFKCFICFSV
jgi:hypothetical protein